MRFLIDNSLSPQIAQGLRREGHDAVHVRDYALQDAEDEPILERAACEQRIVVTADTDFGTLLTLSGRNLPSVILFRRPSQRPGLFLRLLLQNLPEITGPLELGCIVVVEEKRIRVRLTTPSLDDAD